MLLSQSLSPTPTCPPRAKGWEARSTSKYFVQCNYSESSWKPKDLALIQEMRVSYFGCLEASFTSGFGAAFHRIEVVRAWPPVKRGVTRVLLYCQMKLFRFPSSCLVLFYLSVTSFLWYHVQIYSHHWPTYHDIRLKKILTLTFQ